MRDAKKEMPHHQPFPVFRLATLLARQLSSPIATRIKAYAKTHPRMSKTLCGGCANIYRTIEFRFKMLSLQLSGAGMSQATMTAKIPPLSTAQAIEVGGDLLGEVVIFMLGATILIFELNRQARNQEVKELNERSRWLAISIALEELSKELVLQQHDIDRLHAALLDLQNPPSGPGGKDRTGIERRSSTRNPLWSSPASSASEEMAPQSKPKRNKHCRCKKCLHKMPVINE